MKVKLLVGKNAGAIQDLPYHAATQLTSSGQAIEIDGDGKEVPFPHQAVQSGEATKAPATSDASGRVITEGQEPGAAETEAGEEPEDADEPNEQRRGRPTGLSTKGVQSPTRESKSEPVKPKGGFPKGRSR